MADQLFCVKRLDWDAPVTEVLTLVIAAQVGRPKNAFKGYWHGARAIKPVDTRSASRYLANPT